MIVGYARSSSGRLPQAALLKGGYYVALLASGMTAQEHFSGLASTNRKAWAQIVMRRAAGHPGATCFVPTQCPDNGFG
jgi:hypothetical protein